MPNPDPWFITERAIPDMLALIQVYRVPAMTFFYAVSHDRGGIRYRLAELRSILVAAEQAEAEFTDGKWEQP